MFQVTLHCNLIHLCPEVHPIYFNGQYTQASVYRIFNVIVGEEDTLLKNLMLEYEVGNNIDHP